MEQLHAEQRAFRLAEMRRRLGITQAQTSAAPVPCQQLRSQGEPGNRRHTYGTS
jgi:hypothetical protein